MTTERQPLVSVLMPCYNASRFLKDALNSVVSQDYANLEILVIDDGSRDDTAAIISTYVAKDSRVRLITNDVNLGLIRTLNKGIALSSGKYIARMDADDISAKDRIRKLVDILEQRTDIDVVSAGCYTLSESGKVLSRVYPKALSSKALKFVSFFLTPVLHPSVVFRGDIFRNCPFDEDYLHSEDYEIFSRMLLEGYRFLNTDESLYYLRKNSQSVSHKYETIQVSTHNRISYRNIHQYFELEFDYFVQRVMTNRINFTVSYKVLREAESSLMMLRDIFILRESPGEQEIAEINGFLTEQLIDIHLQSLKHARGWFRLVHIFGIISRAGIFLSPRGVRFLKSKNWIRRS